jgi:hypothetical protein
LQTYISVLSSYLYPYLPNYLFPSRFMTKTLHSFSVSPHESYMSCSSHPRFHQANNNC